MEYAGQAYHFKAMPFGLCTAPEIFTQLAQEAAAIVKKSLDIEIFISLDDWLLVHSSRGYLAQAMLQASHILENLGFLINQEKSVFTPSQSLVHLGTVLDFTAGTVTPTPERIQHTTGRLY
jgi:hypothetical protein